MTTNGYRFELPDKELNFSVISFGVDALDALEAIQPFNFPTVQFVAVLNDEERLRQSPIQTRFGTDNQTDAELAAELIAHIPIGPSFLVTGPDEAGLDTALAFARIRENHRFLIPFVLAPDELTSRFVQQVKELEFLCENVLLFSNEGPGTLSASLALHESLLLLLQDITDATPVCADFGRPSPWHMSGLIVVTEIEADGPDRLEKLLAQQTQLIPDELTQYLPERPTIFAIQTNNEAYTLLREQHAVQVKLIQPLTVYDYRTWLWIRSDDRPSGSTMRLRMFLWKPLELRTVRSASAQLRSAILLPPIPSVRKMMIIGIDEPGEAVLHALMTREAPNMRPLACHQDPSRFRTSAIADKVWFNAQLTDEQAGRQLLRALNDYLTDVPLVILAVELDNLVSIRLVELLTRLLRDQKIVTLVAATVVSTGDVHGLAVQDSVRRLLNVASGVLPYKRYPYQRNELLPLLTNGLYALTLLSTTFEGEENADYADLAKILDGRSVMAIAQSTHTGENRAAYAISDVLRQLDRQPFRRTEADRAMLLTFSGGNAPTRLREHTDISRAFLEWTGNEQRMFKIGFVQDNTLADALRVILLVRCPAAHDHHDLLVATPTASISV